MTALPAGDTAPAAPGAAPEAAAIASGRAVPPGDASSAGEPSIEPREPTASPTPRRRLELDAAALAGSFWSGTPVGELIAARATVVDCVLVELWQRTFAAEDELALVAVGGFGRGELFPHSDVDLLVLTAESPDPALAERVERWFAALWDEGLKPGHAVRSPSQCRVAAADLTIATAMMESRRLAGSQALFAAMAQAIAAPVHWPVEAFFAAKLDEQSRRRARYHDTAHNLEPNLKEGPGGLRDLQLVVWLGRRHLDLAHVEGLAAQGLLSASELAASLAARETLWRARYALHLVARRAEERLLFEHQRNIAARFGLVDEHAQNLAVEQFMQGYYRAAMTADRMVERVLQRLAESLAASRGERQVEPLDADFVAVAGYLDLAEPIRLEHEPKLLMRAFARLAEQPELKGFRSRFLAQLDEALPQLEPWLRDAAAGRALLDLLKHPRRVAAVLTRMSRYGVLARIIPAFGRVAGRMQYDLFHVYTVDQHTLAVAGFVQSFFLPEGAAKFALAHELVRELRRPELLYLAALFHDIAKGRGGDHSELGEIDAREFCQRQHLPAADVALVAWLVREHLVMSVTAQKKDIADPDVVRAFAERVGERERLDYLYCLTVADINGTSPKLWNQWKDRLLADLYHATRHQLAAGLEHPAHVDERIADAKAETLALLSAMREASGERGGGGERPAIEALWHDLPEEWFLRTRSEALAWQTECLLAVPDRARAVVCVRHAEAYGASEVLVRSPDRDGLFATLTAVLDRFQLSVVEARVMNAKSGLAIDLFRVLEPAGHAIATPAREHALRDALLAELAREPLAARPVRRLVSRTQRAFPVPLKLEFETRGDRTELALRCNDRPGLLAQIALALRESRVRVHAARIATFGEKADDAFLLSDESDRALDRAGIERLEGALRARLSS